MDVLIILFYIWTGTLMHIINYLKQVLFQGKDVLTSPWGYIRDLRFTGSLLVIMGLAQGTWLVDALIRQKLKLSQTLGFTSLISVPISVSVMIYTLWLSERYLSDKIVWWAIGLIAIGTLLTMIGGAYILGGHK